MGIDAKRFCIHDDQKVVLDFLLHGKVAAGARYHANWRSGIAFALATLPREDGEACRDSNQPLLGVFLSGITINNLKLRLLR
ncbi:hypothetical protein KCP73_21225 [Salmonella enterica subsp. enterica]|nr:hypothetical protein KCP73_21225 [Salmonella enterica subsp. enterica]